MVSTSKWSVFRASRIYYKSTANFYSSEGTDTSFFNW